MRAALVHVCREATESWCVNVRLVAGSRQMAIVDYNVGQWSSSASRPPHSLGFLTLRIDSVSF